MSKSQTEGKGIKREIKFRAWDIEKGEMLTPDMSDWYINFECSDTIVFCNNMNFTEQEDYFNEIGKVELMQYTGLKDKNGKDIYEGDLIECAYCKKEYGEVVWNKEMLRFELKWKDENCGNARHTRIDDWSNVVGNIYQNPELLINHPTNH